MVEDEYGVLDDTPRTPVIREVPKEPSNLKRNLVVGIWVIVLVLLALFIGQNWRTLRLDFLFWQFSVKLSFALLAAAAVGLIIGFTIPVFWGRRRKK